MRGKQTFENSRIEGGGKQHRRNRLVRRIAEVAVGVLALSACSHVTTAESHPPKVTVGVNHPETTLGTATKTTSGQQTVPSTSTPDNVPTGGPPLPLIPTRVPPALPPAHPDSQNVTTANWVVANLPRNSGFSAPNVPLATRKELKDEVVIKRDNCYFSVRFQPDEVNKVPSIYMSANLFAYSWVFNDPLKLVKNEFTNNEGHVDTVTGVAQVVATKNPTDVVKRLNEIIPGNLCLDLLPPPATTPNTTIPAIHK